MGLITNENPRGIGAEAFKPNERLSEVVVGAAIVASAIGLLLVPSGLPVAAAESGDGGGKGLIQGSCDKVQNVQYFSGAGFGTGGMGDHKTFEAVATAGVLGWRQTIVDFTLNVVPMDAINRQTEIQAEKLKLKVDIRSGVLTTLVCKENQEDEVNQASKVLRVFDGADGTVWVDGWTSSINNGSLNDWSRVPKLPSGSELVLRHDGVVAILPGGEMQEFNVDLGVWQQISEGTNVQQPEPTPIVEPTAVPVEPTAVPTAVVVEVSAEQQVLNEVKTIADDLRRLPGVHPVAPPLSFPEFVFANCNGLYAVVPVGGENGFTPDRAKEIKDLLEQLCTLPEVRELWTAAKFTGAVQADHLLDIATTEVRKANPEFTGIIAANPQKQGKGEKGRRIAYLRSNFPGLEQFSYRGLVAGAVLWEMGRLANQEETKGCLYDSPMALRRSQSAFDAARNYLAISSGNDLPAMDFFRQQESLAGGSCIEWKDEWGFIIDGVTDTPTARYIKSNGVSNYYDARVETLDRVNTRPSDRLLAENKIALKAAAKSRRQNFSA